MNPVDFRDITFSALKARGLEGLRGRVLAAWVAHGPCTTRQLATKSGIDLLTLRPRTTELLELGLVRLSDLQPAKGEGTYRAASESEAFAFLEANRLLATTGQRELPLGV
ncbi:MAG: hypothetical protein FJ399_19660 [Verrucomicrobia bacterium]|nr:hypothetical protein [Verrucomicrobiota bacterium]